MAANDNFARQARRVLALARRELPPRDGPYTPESVERDLTFLGLAAMTDPPRKEVTAAMATFREAGIRVANLRFGLIFSPRGGALGEMLLPFKLGLGGPVGNGKQWVSWIHLDDIVGTFLTALDQPEAHGPINGTAPEPLTAFVESVQGWLSARLDDGAASPARLAQVAEVWEKLARAARDAHPADVVLINFGLVDAWITSIPAVYVPYYPDSFFRKQARKVLKSLKRRLRSPLVRRVIRCGPCVPLEEYLRNVRRMVELMREAAGRGCDIVVFPELALTTFFPRWLIEDEVELARALRINLKARHYDVAVATTGIYCRPSCPAVKPKPAHQRFYASAAAAQEAGYRACKRCRPDASPGSPAWDWRSDVCARAMRLIEERLCFGSIDDHRKCGCIRHVNLGGKTALRHANVKTGQLTRLDSIRGLDRITRLLGHIH